MFGEECRDPHQRHGYIAGGPDGSELPATLPASPNEGSERTSPPSTSSRDAPLTPRPVAPENGRLRAVPRTRACEESETIR